MKLLPFCLFSFILITGCSETLIEGDIPPDSLAMLAYNVSEIHLRSVDGIPYKHHPSDLFASNKLKIPSGKHVVAATLYWVDSYDGRSFSTRTANIIKKVCFIAKPGKSYLVVARFDENHQWHPVVLSSFGFRKETIAESCKI